MAINMLRHEVDPLPTLSGDTGEHANILTMSRAAIRPIESYLETLIFRRRTRLIVRIEGCREKIDPRGFWRPKPHTIDSVESWNEETNAWISQTVPALDYLERIEFDVGVWRITTQQGLLDPGVAEVPADPTAMPPVAAIPAIPGDPLPPEIKWAIQRVAQYLRDARPSDGRRTPIIQLAGADDLLEPLIRKQARPLTNGTLF